MEVNPDAFLPDLALSLGVLGDIHHRTGKHLYARDHYVEGLRAILPLFTSLPSAHGRVTTQLALRLDRVQRDHGATIPDDLAPVVAHLVDLAAPGVPRSPDADPPPRSAALAPAEPGAIDEADPETDSAALAPADPESLSTYVLRWSAIALVVAVVLGLIWALG